MSGPLLLKNKRIRDTICEYATADVHGLILTPKASRDRPLPGLLIPLLTVNNEVMLSVYRALGLNDHLVLSLCESEMSRRLERVRSATPPVTGLSGLLCHLPLFKDVTIVTIGANQTGDDVFHLLTRLLGILVNSPGTKVEFLKLDLTTAFLELGVSSSNKATPSPWNAMCTSLIPLVGALAARRGRIMVCLGTRSTPLIRLASQGPAELDFEDTVVAGRAVPQYYSAPYTPVTAGMAQSLWNAIAQAGTMRIYSRAL